MSVGQSIQRYDLPSLEDLAAQLEALNISPEMLSILQDYALVIGLQSQLGQLGVQGQQVALDQSKLEFERDYLLPFRQEELENDRILAQLGIEGRQLDLQSQRELAEIRRREGEQRLQEGDLRLQQVREIGEFDAFQNEIARKTALINLAAQREALSAQEVARRRGRGRFTPAGIS